MMLDTLHLVAQDSLADGFYAASTRAAEQWLLPLDRGAVRRVNWGAVLSRAMGSKLPGFLGVSEKTDDAGDSRTLGDRTIQVRITQDGQVWEQSYPAVRRRQDLGGGNALDVRIWPNFRLPCAPQLPVLAADRVYYFRIRQQPAWGLNPLALVYVRNDEGIPTGTELVRLETGGGVVPTGLDRFRRAVFYWLPAEGARLENGAACPGHVEPIGLYFENRGLLLFNLKPARAPSHLPPIRWRVGVDFGTTNTCIAYRPLGVDGQWPPLVEPFPIQTAVMHAVPTYPEVSESDKGMESEGAAAIFDFPYRYADEALLTEHLYFPSQLITRLPSPPQDPGFHFEHGFILLRNAVLDNQDARELLNGHPPLVQPEHRVFRVIPDVKWTNSAYRRVFLWHLYKLLVIHAARQGAKVEDMAFSFPRAFSPNAIRAYRNEVIQVFQSHGQIPVRIENFISESVAVQRRIEAEDASADRLVLDVGGGTTDITGLLISASSFQASYCLAAGYVNQFVQASPSLMGALCQAAYKVLGEPRNNRQSNQRSLLNGLLRQLARIQLNKLDDDQRSRLASYSQAAFFGLLGMLEDQHFPLLAQTLVDPHTTRTAPERKAISGFFLSLSLLYGSLACQAARLLRQHRRPTPNLELHFIGNGTRFFRLLEDPRRSFCHLLERLVTSSWPKDVGQPQPPLTVRTRVAELGKAYVAEGLVLGCESIQPAEVVPDRESVGNFEALTSGEDAGRVVTRRGLEDFVLCLSGLLPSGRWQMSPSEETTIVPFCEADLHATLAPLVQRAMRKARDSAQTSAREHACWRNAAAEAQRIGNPGQERTHHETANAIEPVSVSCMRSLLDEVREEYAA